jgi:uncharacterized membrane protein YkvA (DUF1232 family)
MGAVHQVGTYALWFAAHDPRTPWYAKSLALAVAAHTLSPIDLLPDFIPTDWLPGEITLLPPAILLVVKIVPPAVMTEHRAAADGKPISWAGGAFS